MSRRSGRLEPAALGAALALAVGLTSCEDACEPLLGINGDFDGDLEPVVEGTGVTIEYRVGSSITTEELVTFRVETPCACVTFERAPRLGGGEEGDLLSCSYGDVLEVPFVVPKGGACQMVVTATFLDHTSTISTVRAGADAACENLECETPACSDEASEGSGDESEAGLGGSTAG